MASWLRPVLLFAGLAVSLVLTYLAVRDVDFGTFVEALSAGNPLWLAPAFGILAAAYAVRVLRWSLLFDPAVRPPPGPLTRALLAGEFFTSLLPVLRLGELARVVVLHRESRTPRSDALGTVVSERVHDAVALLILFFVAVPFAPATGWLQNAALLLAVLVLALIAGLGVLARFGSRPLEVVLRPFALLPGFSRSRTELAAAGILRGLSGLRTARAAALSLVLSLLFWLAISASFALAMRVVGLELPLDAGIIVAVATTFSLLLPALPASVGIFEAAAIVALEPYDVPAAEALSAAVVIHVLSFVPFLVAGPIVLRGHSVGIRPR